METSKQNNFTQKPHVFCSKCGGRCCYDEKIHPSFLKCEKCGKLEINIFYDVSFIGGEN